MRTIRIRLTRSPIGAKPGLRRTVTALGLRKVNSSVVVEATPAIEGMVRTVAHLLTVEEAKPAARKPKPAAQKPKPAAQKPKPAAQKPKPAAQKPKE